MLTVYVHSPLGCDESTCSASSRFFFVLVLEPVALDYEQEHEHDYEVD